jgi:hypothetical protein
MQHINDMSSHDRYHEKYRVDEPDPDEDQSQPNLQQIHAASGRTTSNKPKKDVNLKLIFKFTP